MAEEVYEQVQFEKLRISVNKMEESGLHIKRMVSNTDNNSLLNNETMISYDNILSQIGFGAYQRWFYLIMGLLGITEGSQITLFTLMIPILKNEWHVSDSLNSLQASFIFVGFLTGSMISGQFSDRYGRRMPFIYSSFLTALISFSAIACHDIYQLLFLRAFMGVLVGFFAPCGVTMLSEITPIAQRGKYMSLITLTFALGQLYGLLVASFFMTQLGEGDWRSMTFYCTIPGALAWIISLLKLDESARFELLMGDKEHAFKTINKMAKQNSVDLELTEELQQQLINWANSMNKLAKSHKNASVSALFQGERLRLTCLVWFNWFTLSFMYYGIVLLLPAMLEQIKSDDAFMSHNQLLQLVVSAVSDILGAAAASFFIDVKSLGRKNSLVIFFILQAASSVVAYYDDASRFILWATVSKFFLSMTFIFSFQYTAEAYPTKIRTTGVGMANGVGRLGGVIVPWIGMYLSSRDLLSPFLLFAGLSLLTSLSNLGLPFDTLGKDME